MSALDARWTAAARLIAGHRDVLDARPGDEAEDATRVLDTRGWSAFLLGLGDAALDALESGGQDAPWPAGAPASLQAMTHAARDVCALDALDALDGLDASDGGHGPQRRENPRKRAQVDAFARVIVPLAARATRVVDVGSGHGHLTRAIAARIDRPVVGLERDPRLAGRARTIAALPAHPAPSFEITDVLRDGLVLEGADCAIGLHACGELGDAIVIRAAASGASVALVGCCLQKRRDAVRQPLCGSTEQAEALTLPRSVLGLSNLTAGDDGVEATRIENLAGRERRLALRRLLAEAGVALPFGAEIDGLNRRTAQRDLSDLVSRAFALRGSRAPSASQLDTAAAWARVHHARARRLSLARSTLARTLEVFVLVDRALYLEQHGYEVRIGVLFPANVSARNLALVGVRDRT